MNFYRRLRVLAVVVIAMAILGQEAEAAAPWFVIFHGKLLQNRIVLRDGHENCGEAALATIRSCEMIAGYVRARRSSMVDPNITLPS